MSNCNLEFNGKAGINFMRSDNPNSNNKALYNRVYQNAMLNWPRGNNGFAEAGGGWSGGLVFSSSLNGVARGNLVYGNGGEGMISYGSAPGIQTGGTLFEKNVSMDNWSANMYFDNQANDTARQNMLFFSGYDTSSWLKKPSAGYPWDTLYKMNSGISIGDECSSSGNCSANLANIKIYNNLIVGFRLGVAEYAEGKLRNPHGLKNTLIANNTIILPPTTPPNTYTAGIFLRNNGSANHGSLIVNNIVVAFDRTEPVIWYEGVGPDPGVSIERNAYYNQESKRALWNGFLIVRKYDIKQWQQHARCDLDSFFTNPEFVDLKNLMQGSKNIYDYRDAGLMKDSPLLGTGQSLNKKFNSNLEGMPRGKKWNIGAI
ncbi:hypothetical protein [Thiomonas sp. X19]|uniref:hypothetical protein n=1 Tax=Thiomonas sp. X19 TaxID=1050370 RepID=UPI0011BF9934|nr:hypothetical protein [Thiomonas sp. X19]